MTTGHRLPLALAAMLATLAPAAARAGDEAPPRALVAPIWYRAQTMRPGGIGAGGSAGAGAAAAAIADAAIAAIEARPDLAAPLARTAADAAPELAADVAARIARALPADRPAVEAAMLDARAPAAAANLAAATPPRLDRAIPPAVTAPTPAPGTIRPVPAAGPANPAAGGDDDPLEGLNRILFGINDTIDTVILRPIAWTYGWIAPEGVKRSVRFFFRNLGAPVRAADQLLAGDVQAAWVTTGRFATNTTLGVLGLFDVAARYGLPDRDADFGRTLHGWGVGEGPYVVLPLLGPRTLRDGVGTAADMAMDPLAYLVDRPVALGAAGGEAVSTRETLIGPLDDLKAHSLDYYAAVRSAYLQSRRAALRPPDPAGAPAASDADALFDEAK